MQINSNPQKGMRDLLPDEVEIRNFMAESILQVYKKFGFRQIETPCTEDINLLSSGEGGENEKMIFKILKRGEKLDLSHLTDDKDLVDMGLRYDLTVPLCRFYANNRSKLPNPFRVIQLGSVWRAERPQKGRFRQFTQCDIDIVGMPAPLAEAELILATSDALTALNFKNFTIRVNDRRLLTALVNQCGFPEMVHDKVFILFDKLDKIGLDGVENELINAGLEAVSVSKFIQTIRTLDNKAITVNALREMLPSAENIVLDQLEQVINTIESLNNDAFKIIPDLSLVRGMGYYTGMIFEISSADFNSSIAGGGRYDRMIGKFLKGNESVPACGFSIGFERVFSILTEKGYSSDQIGSKTAVLIHDNDALFQVLAQVNALRNKGITATVEYKNKNLSQQLDKLSEQGYDAFALFDASKELEIRPLKGK